MADAPAAAVASAAAADCAVKEEETPQTGPRDGDYVVLWGSYTQIFGVVLTGGSISNNRFGNFHHDDLIGKPWGSKVRSRKGGAWLAMLRPSPEMLTQSLVHRTQIIYHADISLLLTLLDARPGKIICEAGTGSGSVSSSFARALSPGGKLFTFEFHADRQRQAQADFVRYGVSDMIVSQHGDVCMNGFGKELDGSVDGIFLDLPMPWLAIPHADRCLVEGGRIVTFSPCIEQIDKTAVELRRDGRYFDVRMFETLAVNWGVRGDAPPKKRRAVSAAPGAEAPAADQPAWLSYQMPMRGHTGYLLSATRAPLDAPPSSSAPAAATAATA